MKWKLFVLVALIITVLSAFIRHQIPQTVSGTVQENGKPVSNATVMEKGTTNSVQTNSKGFYKLKLTGKKAPTLVISASGYQTREIKVKNSSTINITLTWIAPELEKIVDISYTPEPHRMMVMNYTTNGDAVKGKGYIDKSPTATPEFNTEEYDGITETGFRNTLRNPLSTFSIDVDAASYSNLRRFINDGTPPPTNAIRIEEMINYFDYDYPQPANNLPLSVITEMAPAPWNPSHQLLHIGLQGKTISNELLPPSNLVFLIDVSGSMDEENKLPLLKSSLSLLIEQLRPQDHVSIVVYAGAAGLVLKPTSGNDKRTIREALDKLEAGGSTAGGEGIQLAYATCKEHFLKSGNNRVILATDGDFNVGMSSNADMEKLIEQKRKDGIYLTVLGFGTGNYKDSKMETLADKGNGNYAYIDNITEARKVLVKEFGGTLFTIAKDVKLQLEFNPTKVQAYRLIGYENRALNAEDFKNDQKDAGELGSGHTVTALYEIIPVGVKSDLPEDDSLKYQRTRLTSASNSTELATVKLRYKNPNEDNSREISFAVQQQTNNAFQASENFRWSAAVAEFGMLLRKSEFAANSSYNQVLKLATSAIGKDKEGYRKEFIGLVEKIND
ncbi:DUF3520 domain-containing protein [Pseudoflavitalea sp. G-6-1-2]|uniref:YfbK domain-containing protein n=1 Tax=Pseudoflavitalea sp. G-6-1-2 TaxID=2728841 RepID=UPI00146D9EF6|nr:von Willebrand factor type A domain-containing protein [Pseudoflavitalea sp. G-6-1-2]NML21284.1 DUF3520 domain-containing protein [Pseudoflavitalea sp. G-6-1-2]